MGINFFDTANAYSDGTSEEIVGQALKDYTRRDEVVIATKVFFPMSTGPNGGGLSRKAIFTAIDASLRRLGTDYVDLYQIHRWDPTTPIEETLEALHDVVKAGKARYLGASSMYAWQFAKALHLRARTAGRRSSACRISTTSCTARRSAKCCRCAPMRASPSYPGARSPAGVLRVPGRPKPPRSQDRPLRRQVVCGVEESDRKVVEQVVAIAAARGVPRAQVALAWLIQKSAVTAPIVGASKPQHLDDAAGSPHTRA